MKLVIVEHELNEYNNVTTITANSKFKPSWDSTCAECQVSPEMIDRMVNGEVIGWVDGTNRFGVNVKRTCMIIKD